jgi:DivIVA domain-containing protein
MATEIDLPFLPSAAQIRRREFASVRRGYDPDQVRDYLAQVAEQVGPSSRSPRG